MAQAKALKPKQSRGKATAQGDYSPKEAHARFERAVDVAVATKPMHVASKSKAPIRKKCG
jgi:hypothetical protein